jgi:hypothetical protein
MVVKGKINLTIEVGRDKIYPLWERSSMAEQWPFKPLVESSSLSALTKEEGSGISYQGSGGLFIES